MTLTTLQSSTAAGSTGGTGGSTGGSTGGTGGHDGRLLNSCRRIMNSIVWISILIQLLPLSAASADEKLLFKELFATYEPGIRPRLNSTDTIIVTLNLELNQLKEIEEKGQVQRAVAMIEAEWYDDYLTWDPLMYNNITEIVVPPSKLWLPDFGIQNSIGTFYQETFYQFFRAHVAYSGRIIWSFGGLFETSCSIDTTIYPFDKQRCSIVLENWAYNKRAVELVNGSDGVLRDNYLTNGLWEFVGSSVEVSDIQFLMHPGEFYPQMTFYMEWQRKPRYYLVNIMLPCVFLLSISLLVFWLPPDAGEKVSLGVTILLAFSVFQLVIADNTPENSDNTPILSVFVTLTMALSTVSVVTTIFVLHLHHKAPTTRPPRCIKFIAFKILARFLRMNIHLMENPKRGVVEDPADQKHPVNDAHAANASGSDMNCLKSDEVIELEALTSQNNLNHSSTEFADRCALRSLGAQIDVVTQQLQLMTRRIDEREKDVGVILEWQAVAKVVDRLLFWIVLLILGSALLWMLPFIVT